VDGTFTNNAGQVQRVRKSIEPVSRSKPDWMITLSIAKAMGAEVESEYSASAIFRAISETVPAYEGLRYPMLKDESKPVQAKRAIAARGVAGSVEALKKAVEEMQPGDKRYITPPVGHKLHRLTTMTSKTPQFHLLANGNPKPENLLVSPLEQFNPDGSPREEAKAEAAAVGLVDRSNVGGR
jgi:NADH dehydrogenase/NADH:ubiquinone oxidoreductase subunit G